MAKILHSKIIGKGKPLIILHGLLGMGDNWISLARKYAEKGFEVHLIDQRNHGKSFHDDEMNYEVMTQDLFEYLSHYRLDKINVIGHSMGGKTAMNFAVKYPDKIEKLIVVDIAPKTYPPHHQFIFEAIHKINLSQYQSRKEIEKEMKKYIENIAIVQFILKNLGRRHSGGFFWKPNISILKQSLNELGEALPPLSVSPVDTLFIKGELSKYIINKDIPLIEAHFPNSKIINIPDSGHWVHAEQHQLFFDTTYTFLKSGFLN
jgi:pimeloyl-ACP methyl ester carboxylesterase